MPPPAGPGGGTGDSYFRLRGFLVPTLSPASGPTAGTLAARALALPALIVIASFFVVAFVAPCGREGDAQLVAAALDALGELDADDVGAALAHRDPAAGDDLRALDQGQGRGAGAVGVEDDRQLRAGLRLHRARGRDLEAGDVDRGRVGADLTDDDRLGVRRA